MTTNPTSGSSHEDWVVAGSGHDAREGQPALRPEGFIWSSWHADQFVSLAPLLSLAHFTCPLRSIGSSRPMGPAGHHRDQAAGCPDQVRGRLVGAEDREGLVDEDVVGPVDADVVDFVLAVAQLHDAVDDSAGVGGQRGFGRFVGGRSADDRA
jgi:hypothetical protein